jgi:hypothetical protein
VTSTVKAATVLRNGTSVTTTCSDAGGDAGALCQGRITLSLANVAVSASKAYKVTAGKTETITVALNKVGLERLAKAKHHVLWVREVITVAGGRTVVKGIRLSPAPVVSLPKSRAAKVVRGGIGQTISCADAICRGTVTLYLANVAVSVPKVYATGAGRHETVRVLLDKVGLARLAKGHVLWVREVIVLKGGATITRSVRLAG